MFSNRLRKYFRYAKMTSFIFETIIEFSAAIRNVYAQLVLMNRGLASTYIMLKICYDKAGNLPNKGRNFNTQTWGKIVYFLFV